MADENNLDNSKTDLEEKTEFDNDFGDMLQTTLKQFYLLGYRQHESIGLVFFDDDQELEAYDKKSTNEQIDMLYKRQKAIRDDEESERKQDEALKRRAKRLKRLIEEGLSWDTIYRREKGED